MEVENVETPADADISPGATSEIERMLAEIGEDNGAKTEESTGSETAEGEPGKTEEAGPELDANPGSGNEKTPKVSSEEEKSLGRIAAKEKEVREATSKFEAERKAFEAERKGLVKPADMRENPTAVLKAAGLDPELVMKQILFEKLPDDSPVKGKLRDELKEYHRDKQISDLRKEIDAKDQAAASQKQYQETISNIEKYAATFKDDNKELPNLSRIGKKDPAYLKDLIVKEIVDDVRHKYITGEGGDPISHEEAAGRVHALVTKIASFLDSKTEVKKPASTVVNKKTVPGVPAAKSDKPQSINDAVEALIAGATAEYRKSETNLGRR